VGGLDGWLKPQAGAMVDAAPLSSKAHPALADAPGTYVLEHWSAADLLSDPSSSL
jgi:hypothetical protein